MNRRCPNRAATLAVVLVGFTATVAIGQPPDHPPSPNKPPQALALQWEVGDRWMVRATALQSPVSADTSDPNQQVASVDWQFTVTGTDKIRERSCYRVAIECLNAGPGQPSTILWLDAKTHALTRVEAKMMVRGQWRVFTETYVTPADKPAPVLGPLPALPLDFPILQADGRTKSLARTSYQTFYGSGAVKTLGDVGFTFAIDQSVTPANNAEVKSLALEKHGPDLTQIELRGAGRTILQLWSPGEPWPSYANNGMTEALLLDVKRAAANGEDLQ